MKEFIIRHNLKPTFTKGKKYQRFTYEFSWFIFRIHLNKTFQFAITFMIENWWSLFQIKLPYIVIHISDFAQPLSWIFEKLSFEKQKKLEDFEGPTNKPDVGNPQSTEQLETKEEQPKFILLKRSLSTGEKPEDIKLFMFQHFEGSEFEFKKMELSEKEKEILSKRNIKPTPQVGNEFDSEIGRLSFYNFNLKEKCEFRKVYFTEEIHEYENGEKKPHNIKTYSEPLTYEDVPNELVVTLIDAFLF